MDIKLVCRLCCSNDGVKHNLFTQNEKGISLAEEIRILTDLQISKEDNLSDCICATCYKVNSFFKEFKKNCTEVNDYLMRSKTSEESIHGDIIIKEESPDDYEDHSVDPVRNQREDASRNSHMPYPVALVQSLQRSEDLNHLRANFVATKRSREEASASVTSQNQNNASGTSVRRAEKRKNDDSHDTRRRQRPRLNNPQEEDLLSHVVKQEEIDICDSPAENDVLNNEDSLNEPLSPPQSHHSLDSGNAGGHSSMDDYSVSSASSFSSDDSDDDNDESDMLMLLALLL